MGFKIFDQYTYLHFASGIIAYFFNISILSWIVLHSLFEIIENSTHGIKIINTYLKFWPGGKPYQDTFINSIGDTIGTLLGWLSAYLLDKYGSKYKLYKRHLNDSS
jgi:hypothetical protein